jgi:hypothetical protein
MGLKDFAGGLDNGPVFCNSNCDHRSRQAGQSASKTAQPLAGEKKAAATRPYQGDQG